MVAITPCEVQRYHLTAVAGDSDVVLALSYATCIVGEPHLDNLLDVVLRRWTLRVLYNDDAWTSRTASASEYRCGRLASFDLQRFVQPSHRVPLSLLPLVEEGLGRTLRHVVRVLGLVRTLILKSRVARLEHALNTRLLQSRSV